MFTAANAPRVVQKLKYIFTLTHENRLVFDRFYIGNSYIVLVENGHNLLHFIPMYRYISYKRNTLLIWLSGVGNHLNFVPFIHSPHHQCFKRETILSNLDVNLKPSKFRP